MSDRTTPEPVKPLKNLMFGIGLPGIIMLGCAVGGIVISVLNGASDWKAVIAAGRFGFFWGFIISLVGVLDIVFIILIANGRFLNRIYRALGYLIIWSGAGVVIWYFH